MFSLYQLPFDLAENVLAGFSLLDGLEPALEGEARSTVARDIVLTFYRKRLEHSKALYSRNRADRAVALGARPFVPATRIEAAEDDNGPES